MKKIYLSLSLLAVSNLTNAQQVIKCFTDELREAQLQQNSEFLKQEEIANQAARINAVLNKNTQVRYIPVVFHVIHKYGFENISQAQIADAIRVLNEDFRKKTGTKGGSSTDPLAVDMLYEFRLAQFDPSGNPTNGINRIFSLQTDNATESAKALSYWDKNKYFNIWVVNTINNTGGVGTILGYAQFPFFGSANTDGVVIRADQMGAIEIAQINQAGRTLTHEAGHWVGLYHPFQNGCANSNCNSQGDQVCDTPPVASSTSGCPSNRNSCSTDIPDLPDQVKNYMDYADGDCMNLFSAGQKVRVDGIMPVYRSNVYGTTNINNAGINADGSYRALQKSSKKAPYFYDFENANFVNDGWKTENYTCLGDSGWHSSNAAALAGSRSMGAQNTKVTRLNVRNAFISPSIDVTNISNPAVSFFVAYTKKLTVSNDRLKIYVSNSFGREEILIKNFTAAEIESAPLQSNPFFPNATQWKKITLDLSAYKSYTNLSVKFELQNLRGNNIFIDNFSIGEFTGTNEKLKSDLNFTCYPNPANNEITLNFNLTQNNTILIDIADINGKVVKTVLNDYLHAGSQQVKTNINDLANGIYFIKTTTSAGTFTSKIIVAK